MSAVTALSAGVRRCLGLRWRLPYYIIPHRPLDHRTARPSRRFSAALGRTSWRANLRNNPAHGPPHLARRRATRAWLPRAPHRLRSRTRQDELIMHDRHHIRPAFHLLGGPQARRRPQQILLIEPVAVFLAVAPPIQPRHFL